jgi:hypothetical protein
MKTKAYDARTVRMVARWHNKRRRELNWCGIQSTSSEIRRTFFAHAEAHGNAARELGRMARTIETAAKRKAKR